MQNTSLFALTGSEGQIQRAEAIRAKSIQALVDHLARALGLTPLSKQSAASFLEEAARQWYNRQPTRTTC